MDTDPTYLWLSGGGGAGVTVPPTVYTATLSGMSGDPEFILGAMRSGGTIELYTIVLTIDDLAAGSLVQIREMAGGTGRIVFRAIQGLPADANATGTISVDPATGIASLELIYGGETLRGETQLTKVQQINRTLYLNSILVGKPCGPGFTYDPGPPSACLDVDECATNNGGCDALTSCTNTPGSFSCGACPVGYTGTGDTACVDLDECLTSNGGCDALTTCSNTIGAFVCGACPAGYTGTGATSCVDVDECLTGNGGCDALTSCTNTPGAFVCGACPAGFAGTGATGCSDVDECLTNNGGCDALTTCSNTIGAFVCGSCPAGYTGTGDSACADVDECLTGNGGCDALTTCSNTLGAFVCGSCPAGYTSTGDTACADVDECLTGNGGCPTGSTCTNQPGTHVCGPVDSGATGCGCASTPPGVFSLLLFGLVALRPRRPRTGR